MQNITSTFFRLFFNRKALLACSAVYIFRSTRFSFQSAHIPLSALRGSLLRSGLMIRSVNPINPPGLTASFENHRHKKIPTNAAGIYQSNQSLVKTAPDIAPVWPRASLHTLFQKYPLQKASRNNRHPCHRQACVAARPRFAARCPDAGRHFGSR